MKTKILALTIFAVSIVGCTKQTDTQKIAELQTQFAQADQKISTYLAVLDNSKSTKVAQEKILCEDYPRTYENEYMPAVLKLTPGGYTQEGLLKDLKVVLDYYSTKLDIRCT